MKFIVEHLDKSFGKKQVINDASFEFEEGKIYGLLGRNGAGKTTFFNCINKDIKSDGGSFSFLIDGAPREVEPGDIGYVLSTPVVPEFLTAREFLKFFSEINPHLEGIKINLEDENIQGTLHENAAGYPEQKAGGEQTHASQDIYQSLQTSKIDALFDIVKLAKDDRDKLLKDFSHGMKNKVQMLIALMSQPRLLLLDEPLTSLDVVVSEEMKQLLRKYKDGRITIFSTHILDLAVDLCDEIVLLSGGKLQRVDHSQLSNSDFKAQIIKALQEEDEVPREEEPGEDAPKEDVPQEESIKEVIPQEEVSQIKEGMEDVTQVIEEMAPNA